MTLEVARVRVPFRQPFATAAGPWTAREAWIVVRRDGPERIGLGESPLEDAALDVALDMVRLDLAGWRPASTHGSASMAPGSSGASPAPADESPWVGVNATIAGVHVDGALQCAAAAVGAGFRTLKLKAAPGEGTTALVARLAAVRSAIGWAVALRLDANGTWDRDGARERLRTLESVGLQYVEQPLPPSDLRGAATLRAATGTPIAADEGVTSVAAASAVLEAGAADVLVVKPGRVGGPTAAADIARTAAARGVPVVISSLFETGIGLAAGLACAASLPDVDGWPADTRDHGLATGDLLEDDLLARGLVVEAGRMRAPGGPGTGGLGVRLDAAALEHYKVADR